MSSFRTGDNSLLCCLSHHHAQILAFVIAIESYLVETFPGMDAVGGSIYMYLPEAQNNALASFNGKYGNPVIQFDASIGVSPNVLIQLSTSNAAPVDSQYFQKSSVKDQELTLTRDLSDAICQTIKEPGNPFSPVYALYKGVYWIHDPRFVSHCTLIQSVIEFISSSLLLLHFDRKLSRTLSKIPHLMAVAKRLDKHSTS